MPEFNYTARTSAGKNVSGEIVADSKREALRALFDRSLFPMKVESSESLGTQWQQLLQAKMPIKTEILANNLSQLADLLQNGVPLLDSLRILADQAAHPRLAEILRDVHDRVADGQTLDVAMAHHPRVFDDLTISMVRAGSEGAFLEEGLQRTADFMELQQELKSRLIGAMAYPVFLAATGFVVTLVLIIFFVPKFASLFEHLERAGGLPSATVALLAISNFLASYGILVGMAAVGLIIWVKRWFASPEGRLFADRWKLKIPLAGPIFLSYAVSRFCRVLGTLLRNGVPLLKSLNISSESAGNSVLARAIRASAENISAGNTLSRPLAGCGLIPQTVMAMIRVAEESNSLDSVLVNIADVIDRKTARQLDIMVRLVEPMMLLAMGAVILFILTALLLPIFDMSAAIG
ncbi:MAG: type II secretion system F family protein [Pirellulaceae bacterium]